MEDEALVADVAATACNVEEAMTSVFRQNFDPALLEIEIGHPNAAPMRSRQQNHSPIRAGSRSLATFGAGNS
jgi:hypothetical protein